MAADPSLPRSARRVQAALEAAGLDTRIVELPDSARTAPEAAAAVGVEQGAIVKSLLFRGQASGDGLLALVSGDRRADEARLAELLGEPIGRADAGFVRAATGYAIGGVPPLGHAAPLRTVMDEGLWRFAEVWAAAGTPHCVFPVAPAALAAAVGTGPAAIAG
jgi:prolyl-tRNA editing enzyme YbaK/EbsC (Cys-tRNA(Pro) deacylase)